jgi:WD40 repeat protein
MFSPDGNRLVIASDDKTANVWDAELLILVGHTDCVLGVIFSSDGTKIATASVDGSAIIWDVATAQELLTLTG